MVKSIDSLSNNVGHMTTASVSHMQKYFQPVNKNMTIITSKFDNLDSLALDLTQVSLKIDALEPIMLINVEETNKNMASMKDSMQWMQRHLNILCFAFSKPLRLFNNIPIL